MKLKTIILPAFLCILVLCSCGTSDMGSLSTDNESTSIPPESTDDTTESEIGIRGIYQIEEIYCYDGEENNIEQIALILYEQLLADMMAEDDKRDFKIIEYENIDLDIISFDQNEPGHPYSRNLDENTWYVYAEAGVKYTGIISPIGSSDGDAFYIASLGERYIQKNNGAYYLIHDSVFGNA